MTPQEKAAEEAAKEELRLKAIEEIRLMLEKKHECKVTALSFPVAENDKAVLYVKEPDRYTKMKAMDVSENSYTSAAALVLSACAIVEESDARFFDQNPKNDALYLGALMEVNGLVQYIVADVKKK